MQIKASKTVFSQNSLSLQAENTDRSINEQIQEHFFFRRTQFVAIFRRFFGGYAPFRDHS